MKILSNPAGDALLTNAEVMHWLRDQSKDDARNNDNDEGGGKGGDDAPRDDIPLPPNARLISDDLLDYFKTCPSANQTMQSVGALFKKLQKYKLSDPELLMIANIRPEAYAHITPLIADIHNRFDYDTILEILKVVNTTLEPRPDNDNDGDNDGENENGQEEQQAENADANDYEGDTADNGADEGDGGVIKKEVEEADDAMAD